MKTLDTMTAYKQLVGYYQQPVQHRDEGDLDPLVYHTISQPEFNVTEFKFMDDGQAIDYFSYHYQTSLYRLVNGLEISRPIRHNKDINPSGTTHGRLNKNMARSVIDQLKEGLK